MALYKVTNKRIILTKGQRIEPGMSAEVSFNGSVLPLVNSAVKTEIQRQFKTKYNVDLPSGYINNSQLQVDKI